MVWDMYVCDIECVTDVLYVVWGNALLVSSLTTIYNRFQVYLSSGATMCALSVCCYSFITPFNLPALCPGVLHALLPSLACRSLQVLWTPGWILQSTGRPGQSMFSSSASLPLSSASCTYSQPLVAVTH